MAVGFNKGHNQECEQAEAQVPPHAPSQGHQVHTGHDPNGIWLCPYKHTTELLKVSKNEDIFQPVKKSVRTHIRTKKTSVELNNVLAAVKKEGKAEPPLPIMHKVSANKQEIVF
jgi:hypothetical protein